MRDDRAHMQVERNSIILGTETILGILSQQYRQDIDTTPVSLGDQAVEVRQRLIHTIVRVGRARPAEDIIVQEYPYGVDTQRLKTIEVGGDRRQIPGAVAVGAELERRAFGQVGVAGVDIVDAADLERRAAGYQVGAVGGDWGQLPLSGGGGGYDACRQRQQYRENDED